MQISVLFRQISVPTSRAQATLRDPPSQISTPSPELTLILTDLGVWRQLQPATAPHLAPRAACDRQANNHLTAERATRKLHGAAGIYVKHWCKCGCTGTG